MLEVHGDDVAKSPATRARSEGDIANQGPTVLLLDAADAKRFLAERPQAGKLLAFSPLVLASLDPETRAAAQPDPITDWALARMVARTERSVGPFLAALRAEPSIRRGTAHMAHLSLQSAAYRIARIWETLRPGGPWLMSGAQGWELVQDRAEAQRRILMRMKPRSGVERLPPAMPLYRLLRRLALMLIRRRGPWMLTRHLRLSFGLERLLEGGPLGLRRLAIESRNEGPRVYPRLVQTVRQAFSESPVVQFPLAFAPDPTARPAVERALQAIEDPVLLQGLSAGDRENLIDQVCRCQSLYNEAHAVIRALRPHCYASRQDSGNLAAVSEAAGDLCVPRFVINYNSLVASDSPIADAVLRFLFIARLPAGLSDTYVAWSPQFARLGERVLGASANGRMRPLRLEPPAPAAIRRAPGPYRVLHASNFSDWRNFFPWVMETSSEFLSDISMLAEELRELDDVELTVRTKPKSECGPEVLTALLPPHPRLRVTGTETPFVEALGRSDLVIGFNSTTLEESLLHRKPVLLWGPVRRYRHFAARTTPPTAQDRAPVYAVASRERLRPMIAAILAAHADRPLSDEEIADYVWPEGTPGLEELAQSMAAGTAKPAAAGAPALEAFGR